MKTLLTSILALSLCASASVRAAQVEYEFESSMLRAVSLSSAGQSNVPPITLSFQYDAKGKILISPGSMAGTNPITGTATIGKLSKGIRTYSVVAKGTALKTLAFTLKGQVGQPLTTCAYKGPEGKYTLKSFPAALETATVITRFTLTSQMDARGKITGTGTIQSGYGNDAVIAGILTGTSNKTSLKWQLKQGTQRLSFSGKPGTNCFYGTLVATVPPGSGSFKNWKFLGFNGPSDPQGGATIFRGSISETSTSGGFPVEAQGATITVSSDLNRNGTIEAAERFQAATAEDGKYNLSCDVADGGRALIEISQPGFAPQLKVLDPVRAGAQIVNNFALRPLADLELTDNTAKAEDGKLELIDLPPEVSDVKARVFNPATEAEQFPGEFADDRGSLLISSVFTAIEARDSSGEKVTELGTGTMLRMQVPKDTWTTLRDLYPGTGQIDCPLYWYDESSGEWRRSEDDGWLEDSKGAKIAENLLADIRGGAYEGNVFVAGPITHLSYWNLDWPVETHACITGVVVDGSGNPVAGANVTIRGATYTGSTSPQVTGPDGRFCADLMRSESAGEDVDGNGVTGETQQVNIGVSYQGQLYSFGPYATPATQSTCAEGGCRDLGPLPLSQSTQLTVGLCTITGVARFAGTGDPVVNAMVFAYDELLDPEILFQAFTNPAVQFSSTTDANGAFSLTVPTLSGPTLFVTYSSTLGAHTYEAGHGMIQSSGCPQAPVTVEVERYRNSAILDNAGAEVGAFFQYGADVSGYLYLSLGSNFYWAVPPDDQPGRVPSQVGESVTWDLHTIIEGQESRVGSITFTATTNIGGTWQATGLDLHGTWGN